MVPNFIVLGLIPGTHIQINFTDWLITGLSTSFIYSSLAFDQSFYISTDSASSTIFHNSGFAY